MADGMIKQVLLGSFPFLIVFLEQTRIYYLPTMIGTINITNISFFAIPGIAILFAGLNWITTSFDSIMKAYPLPGKLPYIAVLSFGFLAGIIPNGNILTGVIAAILPAMMAYRFSEGKF